MGRSFRSSTNKSVERLEGFEKLTKSGEFFEYTTSSNFPVEILLGQLSYLGFRDVQIKLVAPTPK